MSESYYPDKRDLHLPEILPEINDCIKCHLSGHAAGLSDIKKLAQEVSDLIEAVDPFIQKATSAVCPDCTSVCCINRHSYHTRDDILYIHALGKKAPSYTEGVDDAEPCQFLGERGCTISRLLRPYRCTWYFCALLLEHLQSGPAVDYRVFIGSLEKITSKRKDLLDVFSAVACKSRSLNRSCAAGCIYHKDQY